MHPCSKFFILSILLSLNACSYFSHDKAPKTTETAAVTSAVKEPQPVSMPATKANPTNVQQAQPTVAVSKVTKKKPSPTAAVTKKVSASPTQSTSPVTATANTQTDIEPAATLKKSTAAVIVKKPAAVVISTGSLLGNVKIKDKNNQDISADNVIINLEPLGPIGPAAKKAQQHDVITKNKQYRPGVLTIQTNDTLVFKNRDPIKHNVFSSSGMNTFDLGTYGLNQDESITLKSHGIVKVYCNIHPAMVTFISVSDHNISAVSDGSGNYRIDNIPPGTYRLQAWHVRASLDKIVTIKAGQTLEDALQLSSSSYKFIPHLNKFGESYKKKPAIFDDEFY